MVRSSRSNPSLGGYEKLRYIAAGIAGFGKEALYLCLGITDEAPDARIDGQRFSLED
jgi:hypothetical protein